MFKSNHFDVDGMAILQIKLSILLHILEVHKYDLRHYTQGHDDVIEWKRFPRY